jgi:hypothetical protein
MKRGSYLGVFVLVAFLFVSSFVSARSYDETFTLRPNKHYISNSYVRDNPWNGGNLGGNSYYSYSNSRYGMGYVNWHDEGYPNPYYYQPRYDYNLGYYNWRY